MRTASGALTVVALLAAGAPAQDGAAAGAADPAPAPAPAADASPILTQRAWIDPVQLAEPRPEPTQNPSPTTPGELLSLSVGRLELAADFAFAFDHGVELDADFRNARPAGTVKRIPGTSAGMGVRGRWLPAGHDAEGWGLVFGADLTRSHAGGLRKSQVSLFGEWEFGADTTVLAASAGLRRGSRTRGTRLSWGADATAGLRHTRLRVDLCEYNVFTGGCVFAARASDTDVTPYLGLAVEFGAAFTSERGPSTSGAGVRFRLGATWSPRTRFRFQGAAADTGSYDPSGLVLGLTFTLTL